MTRPMSTAQVRKYLSNVPMFEYESMVESVLYNVLELLDTYYEAGYAAGIREKEDA